MSAAILNQGATAMRDALRGTAGNYITGVGVSTANDAFSAAQTVIDPTVGTNYMAAATSFTVIDFQTVDVHLTVASGNITGNLWTLSLMKGTTRTDALTRTVRTASIGVQAGDSYDLAIRYQVQDNS